MSFIFEYWPIGVVLIAIVTILIYSIFVFIKMPNNQQLNQIGEWLLYAVTIAEKELGSGTGQVKLRYVYDMFISKFGFLATKITFEAFSIMVDEALDKFRDLLNKNEKVKNFVEKG